MTQQYDTPSQLPPSLSVASLGDSRAAGLNSVSPLLFLATTNTNTTNTTINTNTTEGVGEGGVQAVQRTTTLLPSLLTSPPSPISPIVTGVDGSYRCVYNSNSRRVNNTSNNNNNNNKTPEMIPDTVMPTVLLENLMRVSGSSFAALSPSLNPSNNNNNNSNGIHTKNLLQVDGSSSDELKYPVQLSTPPSFVLATSFPVAAVTPTTSAVISPTRGTHIRGVAAKEVGCVVLGAGQAMNCAICFSFQDDEDNDMEDVDDIVRCTSSVSSELSQQQKNSEATVLDRNNGVCAGTTNTNTNTTTTHSNNNSNNNSATVGGVRLTCGHAFHSDCLQRWLLSSNICPMCRREVVSSTAK